MKRIVLVIAALCCAPSAMAQLYKYVDKDGKTVYSDQPPANVDSKQLRLQSAPGAAEAAPAPAKTAVQKDKELDKGRKELAEKAKKSDDEAKRAQVNEQRCADAKSNLQVYEQGGRIMKRTESGERVFLEEKDIAAEKEKARALVAEACKKA